MHDNIRNSWLLRQYEEGMNLAANSDILDLAPLEGSPPDRYLARYHCRGIVSSAGAVDIVDEHMVVIYFPAQYLRTKCEPGLVVTWLGPREIFHPNIRHHFCCPGDIPPGMSLYTLLCQIYQMISFQRYTTLEYDALNAEACRWARQNQHRFPVDQRRSLLRAGAVIATASEGAGT